MGLRRRGRGEQRKPRGYGLVHHNGVFRQVVRNGQRHLGDIQRPGPEVGYGQGVNIRRGVHGIKSLEQVLQGLVDVVIGSGQDKLLAARRGDGAGYIGIGEERHRGRRPHQDQVLDLLDMVDSQLCQVGQPVNHRRTGTARDPAGEHLGTDPHPGGLADPAEHETALAIHFPAADHDHAFLA